MRILILEDDVFRSRYFIERFGHYDITITESAFDAIEYLKEETFDYIFLDNDLGESDGTGENVANFLFYNPENPNNKASFIIHSWNVTASKNIASKLSGAVIAPFNTEVFHSIELDN